MDIEERLAAASVSDETTCQGATVVPGGNSNVRRLSPLNDVVFSCLFDDIEKTGLSMKEFLNALLTSEGEEPIAEIVEMTSQYTLIPETAVQKLGRLDVRAKSESGVIFDVEVQLTKDVMNEREYFYGHRLAEKEFVAGMSYADLPRVVMVDICDFYIRAKSNEIVEPVKLMYTKGEREVATDVLKIFHVQLPEFRKRYKTLDSVGDDPFLLWLYLFEKGYLSEEETAMLAQTSEGMRRFAERYGTAIMDPKLADRYDAYVEASHEEASRRIVAEREAELATNRKCARRMRNEGIASNVISRVTGLTAEEIEAL